MRGHNICFIEEILKIIPELSLLLLLIWSPDVSDKVEEYNNDSSVLSEEHVCPVNKDEVILAVKQATKGKACGYEYIL